ncbi:hypothetical protein DL764_001289 [Monosporascus ibericus]|uniref:Rho-GAP domain-containing protein n=1 Tax=Monosporascus ibericus TaxID=155417 RepID=A0A4Q4TUX3_9PEZI|nr:hypothetical protein DL764_001289 [Monosporascus ibericus]
MRKVPKLKTLVNSASTEPKPQGIFGVPLRESITYANVAISLVDEDGKSYIYGYVPIVVAKCGVFLKEHATDIEGIFRLSGSEKRIKELKAQFDSPDRYGKGLVWKGYTVHDAANVLRRYLNDLPEPVVPLDLYERFREPLRGHTRQAVGDSEGTQLVEGFDEREAIVKYQQLIKELPPLNRQLLLYILDLLAVFAAKADLNRMTAQNLAAIFQPGMLSHPAHAMAPEEYRLNQCVIIFLIENQDHFLIGMQGTGTDEKTKQEIEKGTPVITTPASPSRVSGVNRTASTSSAGAESVSRDGMIRRNRSTSSRHSRRSNGASTPNSPALTTTPTGGLARSNTVPSKKSPRVPSGRFAPRQDPPAVAMAPASPSPANAVAEHPPTVTEEIAVASRGRSPGPHVTGRSRERLLDPSMEATTPAKERNLQSLFQRSPAAEGERRQPNKLRKRRMPSSANPSAHSSTSSLPHPTAASPVNESVNPIEQKTNPDINGAYNDAPTNTPSEPTPRASQVPSTHPVEAEPDSRRTLKPTPSPPTSLHSSFNEGSDVDQVLEEVSLATSPDHQDKEKKRRWRMSRRKEDVANTPGHNLGVNSHAEMSTSTVGSGSRPRKSWTGDSADVAATLAESETGSKEKDEPKGPIGWIKNKYREAKETAELKRTKSPPGDQSHRMMSPSGRSLDIRRKSEEKQTPASSPFQGLSHVPPSDANLAPHNVPLPISPPPTQTTHEEQHRNS